MQHFMSFLVIAVLILGPSAPSGRFALRLDGNNSDFAQEADRHLRRYDLLEIDTADAAEQVRRTGQLSISTSEGTFDLSLVPHDVRAAHYRAEEMLDNGRIRNATRTPPTTYKGTVRGIEGAQARFTIDGNVIEGLIIAHGQKYFIEPASRYAASGAQKGLVVYQESDVIQDVVGECRVTLSEQVDAEVMRARSSVSNISNDPGGAPQVPLSPLREVELATEADNEYVRALGSAAAANAEILNIVNMIDVVYQSEVGLTFKVVFQRAWETQDPYSDTTDAPTLLNELRAHWNASPNLPARDLAHMWTGKSLNTPGFAFGGADGSTNNGVVCRVPTSGSFSYGLSQRFADRTTQAIVSGHEIGHNFGATHPDRQSPSRTECSTTIMNSDATFSKLTFCAFSRDQITGFVVFADPNNTCLAQTTAPPQPSNPIDNSQFFVTQQYRDFLNREPDAAGLAFWTNEIEKCGADAACRDRQRVNASAAFFLSIEFQETGYLVYKTYKASFGDIPGTPVPLTLGEFLPDTQTVSNGVIIGQAGAEARLEQNKAAFFNAFVQRARFNNQYANMSPAQFVDTLNANTGNSLTQTERNALVNELTANNSIAGRASVLRKVAENAEFTRREKNRAFVLMQYFGYLRRNPPDAPEASRDYAGYQFWLAKLDEAGGDFVRADMVKSFIISTEYRQRFGS